MSETMERPVGNWENGKPVACGIETCLEAVSRARQEGKVAGIQMALKNARAAKRGRDGQAATVKYLESQLKLAKEVPF